MVKYILPLLLALSAVSARSYRIDSLGISSTISRDGTVSIRETRTYNFSGSYSFAYLRLEKKLFKEVYDIRVFEGDKEYNHANSEEEHTFQIDDRKKSIRVKWFYQATDTKKVFTVSYRLRGALRIGEEDTQFHWTYLGKGWKVRTRTMTVEQSFERELYEEDVWFVATGLSEDRLFTSFSGQAITLEADNLSKNRRIKINSIFPTSYLTDPVVNDHSLTREGEIAKVEKMKVGSKYGMMASIFFMFLSVTSLIVMYIKHGKEHKIDGSDLGQSTDLPSEHHPALISFFVSYQKLTGQAILATLFRLAHMKHFKIKEKEVTRKTFFKKREIKETKVVVEIGDSASTQPLEAWDAILADFITLEVKSGTRHLDEIFQKIGGASHFMSGWMKLVDQEAANNNWIIKPPRREAVAFFLVHFVMFLVSAYLIQFNPVLSIISGIAILVIGIIVSFAMSRMSRECALLKRKWELFGEKIKLKKNIEQYDIDSNLILQCSIVLGLDNDQIKKLLKVFNFEGSDFHWFHGGSVTGFTSMVDAGMAAGAGFAGDGGAGAGGGGAGGGGGGGAG